MPASAATPPSTTTLPATAARSTTRFKTRRCGSAGINPTTPAKAHCSAASRRGWREVRFRIGVRLRPHGNLRVNRLCSFLARFTSGPRDSRTSPRDPRASLPRFTSVPPRFTSVPPRSTSVAPAIHERPPAIHQRRSRDSLTSLPRSTNVAPAKAGAQRLCFQRLEVTGHPPARVRRKGGASKQVPPPRGQPFCDRRNLQT